MGTDGQEKDRFKEDWTRARAHWTRFHRIYDYSYLFYRSILTWNALYGEEYVRNFGLQVFVPLTFQTVEALTAQVNRRRLRVLVTSLAKRKTDRASMLEDFDNAEWKRSGGDVTLAEAEKNAFIFGNGYVLNAFVEDRRTMHMPKLDSGEPEKPDSPDDGKPDEASSAEDEAEKKPVAKRVEWEEVEKLLYFGMKPSSLNPYYVFTDPNATSDLDREYVYVYVPMTLARAKEFVVTKGWMTAAEAETKIVGKQVERFDKIRDVIDAMYAQPVTQQWSRGDHVDPYDMVSSVSSRDFERGEEVAFLMRYEADRFEVRLVDSDETLYEDWNVYPHKRIPIVTTFDVKIPGEFRAMGEPEIMRWQQVSTNRVNNMQLSALMMAIVQRYAARADLLEDETDLLFYNAFRPIRLKALPGLLSASQVVTPMPQLDVKDSAFKMLDRERATVQATTGVSDFVIGGGQSKADTATESNNLLAASNARIAEKLRLIDEVVMCEIMKQWHAAIPFFYDTELEHRLFGDKGYLVFLPYDRDKNEDAALIDEAKKKLDAVGETLEEVYRNAGYACVVFRSDVDEDFDVSVEVIDADALENRQFDRMNRILRTMVEVNDKMASSSPNDPRRFDVFRYGKDVLKGFPEVKDVDQYVMNEPKKEAMSASAFPAAAGAPVGPESAPAAAPAPPPAPEAAPVPMPVVAS